MSAMNVPEPGSEIYGPRSMLDAYKNLTLRLGGQRISVAVNNYRNNGYELEKGGTQHALLIKEALRQLDSKTILERCGGASEFVGVFVGKGSPEAMKEVIRCLYDYSDKFIAKYGKLPAGPVRTCANILADQDITWEQTFQAIWNNWIGLDCNGFVGNWLKACDHSLKIGANTRPRDVYAKRKAVRTSVDQIEYWDVVVWANFSHIAAIEDVGTTGTPHFDMCQSAGGGPRVNDYVFKANKDGTFSRTGGYPKGDVGGQTYVISVW